MKKPQTNYAFIDGVKGSGCSQVDDDYRTTVEVMGSSRIHDAVSANFSGVVHTDAHPGLNPSPYYQWRDVEVSPK
ncbi:unnamed protein product [marine sediment metagenome]|uniref:Uncharacterized protein n=1 Tax=marine sediment metagenome TaxID=412755 RepID=X1GJR9_9ZZZZ